MDESTRLPSKKDVTLALLENSSIYVHLDPRHPEAEVPQWLCNQSRLTLQVGLNMVIPIPDLSVDDDGLSCTLSFSRKPYFCRVGWGAIFALVDDAGKGSVWPEDIPPDVASQLEQAAVESGAKQKPARKKRKAKPKSPIALVSNEPDPQEAPLDAESPQAEPMVASAPSSTDLAPLPKNVPPQSEADAPVPERASDPELPSTPKRRPPYLRLVKS